MTGLRRLAVITVLGAMVLGGCGGASRVAPATYTKSVCSALGTWRTTIQKAGVALQSSDPANVSRTAAKTDYRRFVSALAAATRQATTGLRAAGTPDETNGKQIASRLTRAFDTASGQLARADSQARLIRTDSVSTFQLTATAVTNQIKSALAIIHSAIVQGPSCRALQG